MSPKELQYHNFLWFLKVAFRSCPEATQKPQEESLIHSQFQEPTHIMFPGNEHTENEVQSIEKKRN